MKRQRTLAAGMAGACLLAVITAGTAAADPGGQASLVDRYGTLSGALIGVQARSQNLSISSYLRSTQATVYTLPAQTPTGALSVLASKDLAMTGGVPLQAASLGDLNGQLSAAGVGFATSDYADLESLANAVLDKAGSADAQVTAAGAAWVSSLSSLTASPLSAPASPGASMPDVPADALPFGLLLDKSLTKMAVDAPNLVATVGKTGVGSAKAQKAWNTAMSGAWTDSRVDLESTVPDSCTGGMLAIMATGNASAGKDYADCGVGCATGGLYLHNQTSSLFDASVNDAIPNPLDETLTLTAGQAYQLPPSVQAELVTAQPVGAQNVYSGLLSGNGTACTRAAANATSNLASSLPSVWGNLQMAD